MKKLKCIIKRPDEQYGHMTNISDTLENLQETVGGYIETVTLGKGLVMICNEYGKINGLEKNFYCFNDCIVGTVIIIGHKGEEFCDIPIDFKTWKQLLKSWNN